MRQFSQIIRNGLRRALTKEGRTGICNHEAICIGFGIRLLYQALRDNERNYSGIYLDLLEEAYHKRQELGRGNTDGFDAKAGSRHISQN